MDLVDAIFVLAAAFGLDLVFGDPVFRLHPVRLMGDCIRLSENFIRSLGLGRLTRKSEQSCSPDCWRAAFVGGVLVVLLTHCLWQIPLWLGGMLLFNVPYIPSWIFLSVFACLMALLFAVRDLNAHAQRVRKALEANDLPAARTAVSMLVGRDVANLDSAGVSRAAIESLAESFVDSFFATWFWATVFAIVAHLCHLPAVLGALSGAVLHRMASTADSMIGHKDERYRNFGTCAARLDDVLNFLPARLSVLPLGLAAIFLRLNFYGGFKAFSRDRLKHASPNSAHSEAFVAGALELKLAGPVSYDGEIHEKPWLGNGSPNAEAKHIAQVQSLVLLAAIVSAAGVIAVLWSLMYFTGNCSGR